MAGTITNITTKTILTQTGITNDTYPVSGVPGVSLSAFTQTFTAETNFVFDTPPSIDFSNVDDMNDYAVTVVDTKNSKGVVIVRVFTIVYTPDVVEPSFDNIIFVANTKPGYNPSLGNIYSYDLDTSNLASNGDFRAIKLYGDPGAQINIQIWNNTPGFMKIDMFPNTTYTFQPDGTSLSYTNSAGTFIVSSIDFSIPGLKYWRTPIIDEQLSIEFSVAGSNTILWESSPIQNANATPIYLYQYRDTSVTLQLSNGDGIVDNSHYLLTNKFSAYGSANHITLLNNLWVRAANYITTWIMSNGFSTLAWPGSTDGPWGVTPLNSYTTFINTNASIAGNLSAAIRLDTTSSTNLSFNMVVGQLYKITFKSRISSSQQVGTENGVLWRVVSQNTTYNNKLCGKGLVYIPFVQNTSPTGPESDAGNGWQEIEIEFRCGVASGANADRLEMYTTGAGANQIIQISGIRLCKVIPNNTDTTISDSSLLNFKIFPSRVAGSSSNANTTYDFTLRCAMAQLDKGLKYQQQYPSGGTDIVSLVSINPSGLPTYNADVNDNSASTATTIATGFQPYHWVSWREHLKPYPTVSTQIVLDVKGEEMINGYIAYENGCIAKVVNTEVLINNAPMNLAPTLVTVTGTLYIDKMPQGGNAVIDLNLNSWFKAGTTI